MLTYDELPDDARLWIYAADRELTDREVTEARPRLAAFAKTWTSHRRDLHAYVDLWRRRFLVVGIDEAAASASGCSIDASVRFVRELGQSLGVDFFDRMTFFVERDGAVRAYGRDQFAAAFASGEIGAQSIVLDPLVATKAAARVGFAKPLSTSWHARFVGA